jgi:hypothetical protein
MLAKYSALTIAWMFRAFLLFMSLYYAFVHDILSSIILALAFAFAMIPLIIKAVYSKKMHWVYDLLFSILIGGHMIGFIGMYQRSIIYDDILHVLGSFILGVLVFSVIYAYHHMKRITLTSKFLLYLTILCTLAIGAMWEIVEFLWDNFVILSLQYGFAQDSLLDTMLDLSWDFISGIVAAVFMTNFVRKAKESTIKHIFDPIVDLISGKSEKI